MAARDAFKEALETGDVRRLRRIWQSQFPHLPQPRDRREAEISLHIARTAADTVAFRLRAYSHAWLNERGLPSKLPDGLKPKADRIYPQVQEAVGISLNTSKEWLAPALPIVRKAMADSVEDCFANGDRDPQLVKAQMMEAKDRTFRSLFGGNYGREEKS